MGDGSRLSRKLESLLEMPTESLELVAALDLMGGVYGDNTAGARRGLRGVLEQQHLDTNQALIDAFTPAQQQLASVTAQISALNDSCEEIGASLSSAKRQTEGLLIESERLQNDETRIVIRQRVVESFLEKFQLTRAEEDALQQSNIDEGFLGVLDRLKQIRTDSQQLLRTKHQRAGLELMDTIDQQQEAAFERLYRWLQSSLAVELELDETPDMQFLSVAVRSLRQRPVLFKYCIEEMGKSRRAMILNKFLCALTQGGPNGMPRPIELSAHDPVRFVGDMSSWLHQAMASEAELLQFVLGDATELADENEPAKEPATKEPAADDGETALECPQDPLATSMLWQSVLGSAFQAVCRPFKCRVEQSTSSLSMDLESSGSRDWLAAYQLGNLLAFYGSTIGKLLPDSGLTATFLDCRQHCMDLVFGSWGEYAQP